MAVVQSIVPPHQTDHTTSGAAPAAIAFTKQLRRLSHDALRASCASRDVDGIATRVIAETDRVVARDSVLGTAVVMAGHRLDDDRFGTLRGTFDRMRSNDAPVKRSIREAMATPGPLGTSLTSSRTPSVVRRARSSANQQ